MLLHIFRVVSQGVVTYIPSTKKEGGHVATSQIRLAELGGSKFGNEFACFMYGNLAQCRFAEGDIVAASLRFQVRESDGNLFQKIVATDVVKLNR